jgi:uncharacterized protein (TIGR02246 family)
MRGKMYFNKPITVLTLTAMLGMSSAAIAQDATATAPATPVAPTAPVISAEPAIPAIAPAPVEPVAVEAPVATPAPVTPVDASAMPVPVTPATPVAPTTMNQMPMDASNQVMLQSVMLVNLPKADATIVDKLVEAFNSRSYEKYAEMFSKEGFSVVTADFNSVSTPEALKSHWDNKFAATSHFKDAKATATVDSVKDLAPGIALITGKMNLTMDPNTNAMTMFTIVAKYEDNVWKINSMHASSKDMMKMILAAEMKPESNAMMDAFYALVGLLIGFGAAKMMRKKTDAPVA